jgi:hypothetical protein
MNKDEILDFISRHNLFSLERKFDVSKAFSTRVTYDIRESDVFVEIVNKKTRSTFSFVNLSEDIESSALFKVKIPRSKETSSQIE